MSLIKFEDFNPDQPKEQLPPEQLTHTLEYHDDLNPAIFNPVTKKMLPEVRHSLMACADDYIRTITPDIKETDVHDICLTGSNANYNYTPKSDCDLHIMIDFHTQLDEDYCQAMKAVWNTKHNIDVDGFPVEIYPQDLHEGIVDDSGWYSVKEDKWVQQPKHLDKIDVDSPEIITIATKIAKQIEFVINHDVRDEDVLHRLKNKIHALRDQSVHGEFSVHNLAFKELRNQGWIDSLDDHIGKVADEALGTKSDS